MKVAHITPISVLQKTVFNDYHLILPHLLESSDEYKTFYKEEATGYKILDNGSAEAVDFDWEDLLRLAGEIQANEVVVPDVMGDCDRTIGLAKAFQPFAKSHPEFNYVGVVQGKSYSEIVKCLTFFEYTDWISVLAIPRVLANTIHKDIRWTFAEAFKDRIGERFTGIHFLGASHNVKEVLLLKEAPNARGIDTSLPCVMGLEKRLIEVDGYVGRQMGFFEAQPNPKQLLCMEHNMELYAEWAR